MATMQAAVFVEKGQIEVREVQRPEPRPGGLVVGHEPVGRIEELGAGLRGFAKGDRVIVAAITPSRRT